MSEKEILQDNIDRKTTVGDDENLLRLLSFPSCFDVDGNLSSAAFTLYRKNENYLSLNRLYYICLLYTSPSPRDRG